MSTYTVARDYNPAWRWPLVITMVMFALAFVPGVGLVNLLLFVPVGFLMTVNMLRTSSKGYRIFFGYLLLIAAAIITLVVNVAGMFQVTPG